jgi:hypothetical protein
LRLLDPRHFFLPLPKCLERLSGETVRKVLEVPAA